MALSQPSVVYQSYAFWNNAQRVVTVLGAIASGPSTDPSIQPGVAQVYYDQVTNQICIDDLST